MSDIEKYTMDTKANTLNEIQMNDWLKYRKGVWAKRLQIDGWLIRVDNQTVEGSPAEVILQPEYFTADINIECNRYLCLKDVDEALRHEMIHILHTSFEECKNVVKTVLHGDTLVMYKQSFNHACEKFVGRMERLFDSVKWDDTV